jgi:hypothetical protein
MGGTSPWWADESGWSCYIWPKKHLKRYKENKGKIGKRGERD